MHELPLTADARAGVFTLGEALNAGWTPKTLQDAVRKGRFDRLRPGVYRAATPPPMDRFAATRDGVLASGIAIVLANPGAVLSHTTAAVAHGLPVWRLPDRPCITVPPRFTGDIDGAHLHRATTSVEHYAGHAVPTTTVERTVVDIGREHGILDALVVADAALHLGRTTIYRLRAGVRDCRGWPGVRAAREAVELADSRAESPLETASRFKLRGRLPPPEPQPSIYDEHGRFLGRCDFLWEEFGVAGEADGMDKFDQQLATPRGEYKRQAGLERCGLLVARWGSEDLGDLDALVGRLTDQFALAERVQLPRRWTARPAPRFPSSPLHL